MSPSGARGMTTLDGVFRVTMSLAGELPHFRYRDPDRGAGEIVIGEGRGAAREECCAGSSIRPSADRDRGRRATGFARLGAAGTSKRQARAILPSSFAGSRVAGRVRPDAGSGACRPLPMTTAARRCRNFSGALRSSIAQATVLPRRLERHPTIIQPSHVAMVRRASKHPEAPTRA